MTDNFSSLSLPASMLKNLDDLGYELMTPIQAKSLPHALAGDDVIAKAKTGSGKTASFGIPMLTGLNPKSFQVQGLVLCPTRELADQVAKELRRLARFADNIKVLTLCGGVGFGPQLGSLEHGAHIVVGTPGRIQEHLRKGSLKLKRLKMLVLDEADRMLDMGFYDRMLEIIRETPRQRQTLLFSATYPDTIGKMSESIQRNPVSISVEAIHREGNIEQCFYQVKASERNEVLLNMLATHRPESTVVFCNTKRQCSELAGYLRDSNVSALALHGDLEQRERDQVLVRFANNSCSVLVATDVAARGLDIKDLQAVINFELSRDPEIYVHRIGRTGRAGKQGLALSLYTEREQYKVTAIEEYQGQTSVTAPPNSLKTAQRFELVPSMVTLQIDGGRKQKVRPGDILGALTGDAGIAGDNVGKIDINEFSAYVAVKREVASKAEGRLGRGKIKGRNFKVRKLG